MRYFFQFIAMSFDIAIIAAVAFVIYTEPKNPWTWIIVASAFKTWHGQGGFFAWKPDAIKSFLKNAKKIGL